MEDTEKYLIHAAITADGIVERSDVVGAIFGQTEGLLGDDLDLRDLQQSSKVGRIDVEIDSQNGQSFGTVTIASSLDRVKTAILAASLETITRVGPCRATVEVTDIEDVREAKRREVVERAKELLSGSFDESVISSTEILEEVKESVRIEDISEYEGLPAGPHVAESDAVVVVEGRSDVLTLLSYGIKNAIAVEGTNVPDAVAKLTHERTTTAFFDGDRGGELILRELTQVGNVDYVAFAPEGRSVEDLKRHEVFAALRDKMSIDAYEADDPIGVDENAEATSDGEQPDPPQGSQTTESATPTELNESMNDVSGDIPDGAYTDVSPEDGAHEVHEPTSDGAGVRESFELSTNADNEFEAAAVDSDVADGREGDIGTDEASTESTDDVADETTDDVADETTEDAADETTDDADEAADTAGQHSLRDHVREVIDERSGTVRLLDTDLAMVAESPAEDAFDALAEAESAPYAVVIDGTFTQRLLDVAAQRGVEHAVAESTGEFVKKPVGVRLLTADQLATSVAS
ncbi:DNA primase DnaG [Halobellus captivus]|uniref:DNA primase DnaG n=1 Tax=Halobellus captivus TaxID=2592614 RepID=UPI00119F3B5C|nr:DNA primase DnaG [Halobellus captivus]